MSEDEGREGKEREGKGYEKGLLLLFHNEMPNPKRTWITIIELDQNA